MKLKWIQRFILFFGGVIVFLIGAAGILVLSGVLDFTIPDALEGNYYSWQRLAVCGCCLYLMLYALYVFFYPGKYHYSDKDFIVQKTEGGDLLISVKAIESLVQQCVDRHEEIKASNLRVIPSKKDGVVVKMKATMPSNISIPLAVANLQKQIKQYVMASSGVAVKNVIVTVEKTSGAVAVSNIDETLAETNAEKPAEEKTDDKPVHQRLFERHDAPEAAPETAEPEPAPAPDEAIVKEEKTDE